MFGASGNDGRSGGAMWGAGAAQNNGGGVQGTMPGAQNAAPGFVGMPNAAPFNGIIQGPWMDAAAGNAAGNAMMGGRMPAMQQNYMQASEPRPAPPISATTTLPSRSSPGAHVRPPGTGPRRGRPPRNPRPPASSTATQTGAAPVHWTPSLTTEQQQALIARAVQVVKTQNQPNYTIIHALLNMGFVLVRNNQLPPNAGVAANTNGTLLRLDEAAMLGLLPQHGARFSAQTAWRPAPAPFPAPGMPQQPGTSPQNGFRAPGVSARPPSAAPTPGVRPGVHPDPMAHLPLVYGGPPPAQSAVGMPIVPQNTWMTKLPPPTTSKYPWTRLSEKATSELRAIMEKDLDYVKMRTAQQKEMDAELVARIAKTIHRDPTTGAVRPVPWWVRLGDAKLECLRTEPLRLVFPAQRHRMQEAVRARPYVPMQGEAVERATSGVETLVPIRLELEHDPFKLRDTFTWNAAEEESSLDAFAHAMCEDIGLPAKVFVPLIKASVQAQVSEYTTAMALQHRECEKSAGQGMLDAQQQSAWASLRHAVLSAREHCAAPDHAAPGAQTQTPAPHDELRVLIKLDILVGAHNLLDQFEWDVCAPQGLRAEQFAEQISADLGLSGEFTTAIVHAIREQVGGHLRLLSLLGYPFNQLASMDEEVRSAFLPVLPGTARANTQVPAYTPKLVQLTATEVTQLEREHERELRRKRRQTKGRRGINISDKDPKRTIRSVPLWGLQGGIPDATQGHSSRRAATAAASANITPYTDPLDESAYAPKRARTERYDVHFQFPGGLGPPKGSAANRPRLETGTRKEAVQGAAPPGAAPPGKEHRLPGAPRPLSDARPAQSALDGPDMSFLPESDSDTDTDPAPVLPQPPAWLEHATQVSRQKYPHDRFQIQQRQLPQDVPPPFEEQWRIRCLDCPGKVYKPGPGESLLNFEIHLKNRSHRAAVARRTDQV